MEAMKAWRIDPDQWERLTLGGRALIRAHEANLAGLCRSCGVPLDTSRIAAIAVNRRKCGGCRAIHTETDKHKPAPYEHVTAVAVRK